MFRTYILFSESHSRYYVGQTSNMDKRIERHNQGKVKSTKFGILWKIVLQIETYSREQSVLLERKIKKRGAKRYLDDYFGV